MSSKLHFKCSKTCVRFDVNFPHIHDSPRRNSVYELRKNSYDRQLVKETFRGVKLTFEVNITNVMFYE